MACVTSSVVSSNAEDLNLARGKGEVLVVSPDGSAVLHGYDAVRQQSSMGRAYGEGRTRIVPEGYKASDVYGAGALYQQRGEGQSQTQAHYKDAPLSAYREVDENTQVSSLCAFSRSNRGMPPRPAPRYSVLGGPVPPAIVEMTPETIYAELPKEKDKGRLKMGTARMAPAMKESL